MSWKCCTVATEEKSPQEKKNVLADMVALVMLLFFKLLAHWIDLQGEWEYDDIHGNKKGKGKQTSPKRVPLLPLLRFFLYYMLIVYDDLTILL